MAVNLFVVATVVAVVAAAAVVVPVVVAIGKNVQQWWDCDGLPAILVWLVY